MTNADGGEYRQLHETVLDRLGSDIVAGVVAPGTRISADDVVTQYSVSRTVVREVVRVLESLGLLAVRRRVGITVLGEEHWNSLDPSVIRWKLAGPQRFEQLSSLSELRSVSNRSPRVSRQRGRHRNSAGR